jgi:hypothetical protein
MSDGKFHNVESVQDYRVKVNLFSQADASGHPILGLVKNTKY